MVKGSGKSSASSGTRKKHAARKVGNTDAIELPKPKSGKKDKKRNQEPRKKVYIPPSKPAPTQQDPLDSLGLSHQLPADLLVVLRKFSKRDTVTKTKALEEFQAGWVDPALRKDEDGLLSEALTTMLPVWLHHVPVLFLHPSRRVRSLAVTIHALLLRIHTVWEQMNVHLRDISSLDQAETLLGSWALATCDVDRAVAQTARRSWIQHVSLVDSAGKLALAGPLLSSLLAFVQRAVLDPAGLYQYLNPVQVPVNITPVKTVRGRPVPVPVKKTDEDAAPRVRAEGEEESETDRKARLRVGGIGVLTWILDTRASSPSKSLEDLLDLLSNPALWSSLHHAETCPFADIESFGLAQPPVRSAAWSLLQSLLSHWKAEMESLVPLLSVAVLRSAFVDPDVKVRASMLRPWLTFVREFPRAWELELAYKADEDSEAESDDNEPKRPQAIQSPKSRAYAEFLQFLQLGCAGDPLQGYPTVLILLSTIPSSILSCASAELDEPYPASDLFTSFWSAVDGRALSALNRPAISAAFLSSLLECTTFIVRRLSNGNGHASPLLADGASTEDASMALVGAQYRQMWDGIAEGRLRVDPVAAGELVAKNLTVLSQIDEGLFDTAWNAFAPAIADRTSTPGAAKIVFFFLKSLHSNFPEDSRQIAATDVLFQKIAAAVISESRAGLASKADDETIQQKLSTLVDLISVFGDAVFGDVGLAELLDDAVQQHTVSLLTLQPLLLKTYLNRRGDQERTLFLWRSMLSSVGTDLYRILPPLADAAQEDALPGHLAPAEQELDAPLGDLYTDALGSENGASLPLLLHVIRNSRYFVTTESFETFLHVVVSEVDESSAALQTQEDKIPSLNVSMDVIAACFDNRPDLLSDAKLSLSLLPNVFSLAYLLPRFSDLAGAHCVSVSQRLWTSWRRDAPLELQREVGSEIVEQLKDTIFATTVRFRPSDILQAASDGDLSGLIKNMDDILPGQARLDEMLSGLRADPTHASLAILSPLVPPSAAFDAAEGPDCEADRFGLGSYARAVSALLHACVDNRQTAKANLWALRHFLSLAVYADELLNFPSLPSVAFSKSVSKEILSGIISKAQQLATYLLVIPQDDKWHVTVAARSQDGKAASSSNDTAGFVADLIKVTQVEDTYLDSQVLHVVLQHILSDTNKEEADQWMALARKLEKKAPQLSLAIVLAVTRYGPEPPRLDRYRNELAAEALGIRPNKANTSGLLLLRRLAATAPDPESDVVFLPQPRAVNFVKACQQWIASDEDLDEDVESEMTAVFIHLVPILQNVSGSHWDLIFDVIESNLENSSFENDETLTVLWRTIRLVQTIQDLVAYNKDLRAQWQERQTAVFTLLRDLVAAQTKSVFSVPRSICREAALSVIQNMPPSLIDHETLPKMSHLLFDPLPNVQKMSYEVMREAAKKYTEHLVIEAGVDAESTVRPRLPPELVALLQQTIEALDMDELSGSKVLGALLGWMTVFDLFGNASMKVRSGYTEHLRDLDLIGSYFIPLILNILNVSGGMSKAFKLDIWTVNQFYLELYDSEDALSVQLFAAHLYYRALLTTSSLVRTWIMECKDRTLFTALTNYTSTHFSPVIISAEFAHVKSPEAAEELNVENLTVKVLAAASEVNAAYLIDEQRLEITLKVPTDWPLHGIEVKDSKRVGVSVEKWRGWLLGVQQIVSAQNGRIVDAISLFKKNVTAHFDGQVECAICYSIISVAEGDLPQKACKTCKNRFHASCLYKWFNTSHSSTCPLCRSEFM
ncbi:hypothetical protein FA95DRAFT_1682318 [Auriscalpium vulgare]|uniref:Uncharacterized protein n=1 Tax=Auriscalpium vulgare TaxID=40419 RepID=A0ACB8RGS5_9AGAM|nr:hypothetical protein FA95DRAFT_1682318 [Auriscalpium vulgare]